MSDPFRIRQAGSDVGLAAALADVLIDCVEDGASVSYMLPLERDRAEALMRAADAAALEAGKTLLVLDTSNPGAERDRHSQSRLRNSMYSADDMTTTNVADTATPQSLPEPGNGTFIP